MNLVGKINYLYQYAFNLLKVCLLRITFNKRIHIGKFSNFKGSSRINIFDKNGEISFGDYFSMGHNSELYSWNETIIIGSNTSLNDNCKIYGDVIIGSNCLFASSIFVSSGTHTFSHIPSLPIKAQDKLTRNNKRVIIEDDCWIGFGVVIMPGIYIGKGAVIGSNSVITKNIMPYSINGGIPSREIGKRLDFEKSYHALSSDNPNHWPFFYRGCDYKQFEKSTDLVEGIRMGSTVILLFSKSIVNKLNISGVASEGILVDVSLNNDFTSGIQIAEGTFDLELDLIARKGPYPKEFEQLPKSITDNFNVVVCKINGMKNTEALGYPWKICNIGLS